MNPVAPKPLAVLLTLLMLAPGLPTSLAGHTDDAAPDVPVLPHVEPTKECLPMGLDADVLARVNELQRGDASWFYDDRGVPSVCVFGQPLREYQMLIREADRQLQLLRNLTWEVQRQVDQRVEATLPEGDLEGSLVNPQVTLLSHRFDGRRVGGFGDWKVVTEGGEEPGWAIHSVPDFNGTTSTYRFGDGEGYPRGVHQWLVTPEIDLTALKANRTALNALALLHEEARTRLWRQCNELPLGTGGSLRSVCGDDAAGSAIVQAYMAAFDATVGEVPVAKQAAWLEFTYRANLARTQDGVRVWLYAGERAPDRLELYSSSFGYNNASGYCATQAVGLDDQPLVGNTRRDTLEARGSTQGDLQCTPTLRGGYLLPVKGQEPTGAFRQGAPRGSAGDSLAITGDHPDWEAVRLNLTALMGSAPSDPGHRVWLLFEVRTEPDRNRGGDFFADQATFPRQKDYGFEIGRVHAQGDGYHRNVRLKDVGADLSPSAPQNGYGDPESTRVVVPPGNEPVAVRVQNAGAYVENATLSVSFYAVSAGGARTLVRTEAPHPLPGLRPSEVREVKYAWPRALADGARYAVEATLDVQERAGVTLANQTRGFPSDPRPQALEPNATEARPVNAASRGLGGSLEAEVLVRASKLRVLTPVNPSPLPAPVLQACKSVADDLSCESLYAGEKGETRILLLGVRNDGNSPEDAKAVLKLELDGVDKSGSILDGAERELRDLLPGETRALQWTISPAEPGTWRARVALIHEDGRPAGDLVERLVYVQRSTGVLCFDDLDAMRQCAPGFEGRVAAPLRDETVTAAAFAPDGSLYVATNQSDTGGRLLQRGANGEWRALANISAQALNATLGARALPLAYGPVHGIVPGPDGTVYMVGDNATVLARHPAAGLRAIALAPDAPAVHFAAAAWYNGSLWAVGGDGLAFNLTSADLMAPTNLTARNETLHAVPYRGNLTSALVHGGRLHVAGERGYVASFDGRAWTEARVANARAHPVSWTLDNRTVHALAPHGAAVVAVAGDALLAVQRDALGPAGRAIELPQPPLGSRYELTLAVPAPDGALHLLDQHPGSERLFVSCRSCLSASPEWGFPAVPLPPVVDGQAFHPARLVAAAWSDDAALFAGEAGALLEHVADDSLGNTGDWSVVPALAPRDGGVLETNWTQQGGIDKARGYQFRAPAATAVDNVRVRVRHYVENVSVYLGVPQKPVGEVRLWWQPVPNFVQGESSEPVCGETGDSNGPHAEGNNATRIACNQPFIKQTLLVADRPTPTDAWETFDSGVLTPPEGALALHALEFYAMDGLEWAIDDMTVDTREGSRWTRLLWYHSVTNASQPHGVGRVTSDGSVDSLPALRIAQDGWRHSTSQVLWQDAQSAWHISTRLADRPVWVVNDELWPHEPGGTRPHLRSGWDMRLLSPVVDLGQAYDPVLEFRHAYAFRTHVLAGADESAPATVSAGDGGFVEVQYEMQGKECGEDAAPDATCWSRFMRLHPDGGYPNMSEAGFDGGLVGIQGARPADVRWIGPNPTDSRKDGLSYWGRSMFPNEEGVITGGADTSTYQTATFHLNDNVCRTLQRGECLKVNLTGKRVRFAFHVETADFQDGNPGGVGDVYNHTRVTDFPASFAGEGWYITDFKVLGARSLGIDLAASDLRFAVGYDAGLIGVGPGTRVPVNVTVTNNGLFDALGYTGELEVRRVDDAASARTSPVARIPLTQRAELPAGKSANHTIEWDVPLLEDARYLLTFRLAPMGIEADEDPSDNTARLGSLLAPVLAKTKRDFRVDFLVSPENATTDITRYVPVFLHNTGNVPLSGFTVVRDVNLLQGQAGSVVDTRKWTTARPVPPGTRVPLASVSDDLDPTKDLFYKAPDRANYLFRVTAWTGEGDARLVSAQERRVSAYATYLFDDVEGGPRGEAIRGDWTFGPGWSTTDDGFRSPNAYTFGDNDEMRYPADTDGVFLAPELDVSGARSARLAFFHRYSFEPRFDGGVVEASADGGKTWKVLPPAADKLNDLPLGYVDGEPLSAASPLHDTGNPSDLRYGFTGDSSKLPAAVDGWVLSQFDLTNFDAIAKEDVPYVRFDAEVLRTLGTTGSPRGAGEYVGSGWTTGKEELGEMWMYQNLTEGSVTSRTGDPTFWWSGSASARDDAARPLSNLFLQINVSLAGVGEDQTVYAEWWEWVERYGATPTRNRANTAINPTLNQPGPGLMLDSFTWHTWTEPGHHYRYNLSAPEIIGKDGKWLHLRADLTDYLRDTQTRSILEQRGWVLPVVFGYAPVAKPSLLADASAANDHEAYLAHLSDDRGFAIDGFRVYAVSSARGQAAAEVPILGEEDAWAGRWVYDCEISPQGAGNDNWPWSDASVRQPCYNRINGVWEHAPRLPVKADGVGRSWSRVTALPNVSAGWTLVPVVDKDGHSATNPTPRGAAPRAWWTGDMRCRQPVAGYDFVCPRPGSESRLVTPAIDLSIVAGEHADLTFGHRYAFAAIRSTTWYDPLASGGVVEVQEYNPQTQQWGPWKQLYAHENKSAGLRGFGLTDDPQRGPYRGGYSMYTVEATGTSAGAKRRLDLPFETVRDPWLGRDIQLLYSGKSVQVDTEDGRQDGWLKERFDVTDYIGKRVRFGFHAAWAGINASNAHSESYAYRNVDGVDWPGSQAEDDLFGGWWVNDVAIEGKVITGKPILLRWHAATDGNVDDGRWQIDDVGLFGARYDRNLVLSVDESRPHGAVAGGSTVVPITVRNLGDTVRRDVAVEVIAGRSDLGLQLSVAPGTDAQGGLDADGRFHFSGIILAPGQAKTLGLLVKVPDSAGPKATTLYMELKEFNPSDGSFARVADNEVQGLLRADVPFHVEDRGHVAFGLVRTEPALVRPGEPLTLVAQVRNPGFVNVTLDAACSAYTPREHVRLDHNVEPADRDDVAARYECEPVGDAPTLAPGEEGELRYRVVPTLPGFVRFRVEGRVVDNDNNASFTPLQAAAVVGRDPLMLTEAFGGIQDVLNWSRSDLGGSRPLWSYLRGHREQGSLLLGMDENNTRFQGADYASTQWGGCSNGVCTAISPAVDLHNFSKDKPVFLSFWHQDRFAKHDGGQVRAQVLLQESRPDRSSSWSQPCLIRPIGDYEGRVAQFAPVTDGQQQEAPPPPDLNPAFQREYNVRDGYKSEGIDHSGQNFFVSDGGLMEDAWSLAVFDLSRATCDPGDDNHLNPAGTKPVTYDLAGRTVRFVFEAFLGSPDIEPLRRGVGHGWLIDDVSVGPLSLTLSPAAGQKATMLDNTTKSFHVVLHNRGSFPDVVRVEVDFGNSSAPAGSLQPPAEGIELAPGETRIVPVQVTLPRDPSLLPTSYGARLLAVSQLDPNAVGATTLDLLFAPRQWAELSVSVDLPREDVQEGTQAFIPVVVENNGLVESVPTRVRIVDSWDGGSVETTLDLESMPSFFQDADAATRTLEFRWRPEKGSVGLHTLTFEVDPDGRGEEYTRANNALTVEVPVVELLIPDLAIHAEGALSLRNAVGGVVTGARDADVTRYEVTAGEVVSFELKVRNLGRAGATNVDVRAFIGALSLPPKTIPYVGPGQEVAVTFNWLAQKGEHDLRFLARAEQAEATNDNNRNPGVGVTLLTVKGYEVKVDIPAIGQVLEPGTEVAVPFTIVNEGNAGEELTLRAKAPKGVHFLLPRDGFYLRPGETYEATATLQLPAEAVAGEQFISIEAIARENPMKVASARAAVDVRAYYAGSVVASLAEGAPPALVVPVTLFNEGNSLEPWTVDVDLPAGWTVEETLPAKVVVPPHERAVLELHVTLPGVTPPGPRTVKVTATMPNNETREGVATVLVEKLRAAAVSLKDEAPPKPVVGKLSYDITVANAGNVKAPFELVLLNVPEGVEAVVSPASFDLAPGAAANATLTLRPDADVPAGTHLVTGYALFQGVSPQSREGRLNLQSISVPILRQDLSVGLLEYAPRADLAVGDRVTVKVPVHNRGGSPVSDLPVHLYVDDVFMAEAVVPRLGPGERADVTLNWTAVAGTHTLTVVVDPYEDVVDGDRADNAVSALATVGTQGGAGGLAAGRLPVPAPGGALLLLALLGAALAAIPPKGSRRPPR